MLRGHLKHLTLSALSQIPLSGYDLMQTLEQKLGNKPSPGSIYPVLKELEKTKSIQVKVEGRRKVYSLTRKGSQELESFGKLRQKFVSQMRESIKLCAMLTNEDMRFHEYIMGSLEKGEIPFKEISEEMARFRSTIASLAESGLISKEKAAIKRILTESNDKIEQLAKKRKSK